jgi:MFS family permease
MKDHRYKWFVVGLLWFVCFFNYADRQGIFSVFPLLKSEMHLSDNQLGVIGGAFMWVYGGFAIFAGLIGDRLRRKTLIIGGLIFWSLITVATALSTKYWHLVLFRGLEGFGEAFYFPASMSLLSDYHGRETRSRAMSIHQSSVYAGTIAGGWIAGLLGQHYGWRSGFYLFGSLGILLGAVLMALLREPQRGAAESGGEQEEVERVPLDFKPRTILAEIIELLGSPMVRILAAVFVGANFVAMVFLTWMPSFLGRKFNMSLAMAGLSATAYPQTASMLGVIMGGILADRLARRYRGGRMMAQTVGLFAGVPFIFLTGWTLSVPILVVALLGFGYFKGFYDANIWASLYDVVRPERRAAAVGLVNSIGWIVGGAGPVTIAAASAQYGMSACLSATSVIYLFFGLLLFYGIGAHMRTSRPSSLPEYLKSQI